MEIQAVSLLKSYLSLQLNTLLTKSLGGIFDKIEKEIWKIFDPLMSSVKNSIVGAVGEIPFVGGALAVAVNVLFDTLYGVIRKAVDGALDQLEILLQTDIVNEVIKAVMATGLFTNANLQDSSQTETLNENLESSGNEATKKPMSKNQKKVSDK